MIKVFFVFCLLFLSISLMAQEKGEEELLLTQSIERGGLIYEDFCVTCHLPDGNGVEKVFPPLAKSDYLKDKRPESIKAIKFGQKGEIVVNGVVYNSVMVSPGLTNKEVADVMNYISNSWTNINKNRVTALEVSKVAR